MTTPSWLTPIRRSESIGENESSECDVGFGPITVADENLILKDLYSIDHDVIPLGIEEVFDIAPLSGVIKPGESQPTSFSFFGHPDISAQVCALCKVDSGPSYRVEVSGAASKIDCVIDSTVVDFGDLICQREGVESVHLVNNGQIDFAYLIDGECEFLTFSETSGRLLANSVRELGVKVFPLKPEPFHEVVNVLIEKSTPIQLSIKGNVLFPQLLLTLPRPIPENQTSAEYEVCRLHKIFHEEEEEVCENIRTDLLNAERRYICSKIGKEEISNSGTSKAK